MYSYSQWQTGSAIFLGIWFGLPAFMMLVYLMRRCVVVEQGTAIVIERWGRYSRTLTGGWHFLVPFADRPRPMIWRSADVYTKPGRYGREATQGVRFREERSAVIDLRESILDFPSQTVITRDNVQLQIHAMAIYRLVDAPRVVYETYDVSNCIEKLIQTTLRSIIGEMGLDDTLSSREEIERGLKGRLSRILQDWGVHLSSIELLEITPNATVLRAMHNQLSAERLRRAAIVAAEGTRSKLVLEAEGEAQSQIAMASGEQQVTLIRAQAQADVRKYIAKAEADAVRILGQALSEYRVDATQYGIACKFIESLRSIASSARSREIFMPLDVDLGGALAAGSSISSCGSGVGTAGGAGAVAIAGGARGL